MLADARNMASYPPNFIPIVEAFDQAVAALAPAKIAGQEKGPNDAYSVLSTLNREQIRREIEVWNAGGGLSHELAKAVIEFEKQRHFPDFKWRFDPIIQEELLDSIELQLRGSNEYRDLSKAELVDFEDEFEEPAQRVYEAERKVERLFRDALAGGLLDPWVNGRQGMELLSDRESWRPGALGVPGFEPRTHHLTNPGPNDEREALIERGQLKTWLAMLTTAASRRRGRSPTVDWETIKSLLHAECKKHGGVPSLELGVEWRNQAAAENFVKDALSQRGESAAESTVRAHVAEMLRAYEANEGR
jgi:hypothetical protein